MKRMCSDEFSDVDALLLCHRYCTFLLKRCITGLYMIQQPIYPYIQLFHNCVSCIASLNTDFLIYLCKANEKNAWSFFWRPPVPTPLRNPIHIQTGGIGLCIFIVNTTNQTFVQCRYYNLYGHFHCELRSTMRSLVSTCYSLQDISLQIIMVINLNIEHRY